MPLLVAALLAVLPQDDPASLDRAAAGLAAPRLEVRDEHASRLFRAGRAAWPTLRRALRHPHPEVRARAADLLARSRLRCRLSFRVLRDHADAVDLLRRGPSPRLVALIRTLGRYPAQYRDLLHDFSRSAAPEVTLAAAEALYDHRDFSWVEPLLRHVARTSFPEEGRAADLLVAGAASVRPALFLDLLTGTDTAGRTRLLRLATAADLAVEIPIPILTSLLQGPATESQGAALAWIRQHPIPEGASLAFRLLGSPEPTVVEEALRVLRRPPRGTVGSSIASLTRHRTAGVREEALRTLREWDPKVAVRAARVLLQDPSTSVRKTALETLWSIQGEAILDIALSIYLTERAEQGDLAGSYLIQYPRWSRPRLREALSSPLPSVRLAAARLLHRLDPEATLEAALRDPEEEIRIWALQILLRRNNPAAHERVEACTNDASERLRFAATQGLIRWGQKERRRDLLPFLKSEEYLHRLGAAESLLDADSPYLPGLALELLHGKDEILKRSALDALSARRYAEAAEEAVPSLFSTDPRLRRSAARYLSMALSLRPNPPLLHRLRDRYPAFIDERQDLLFVLIASHGDRSCGPTIFEALRNGRAPYPHIGLRALEQWYGAAAPALFVDLLGNDPQVNQAIFSRLPSRLGADAAILRLLRHPDVRVRAGLVGAAGRLSPELQRRIVEDALKDPAAEVRFAGLSALEAKPVAQWRPVLECLVDDLDPEIRLAAARALGRLGPSARDRLSRAIASEECAWVRRRIQSLYRKGP